MHSANVEDREEAARELVTTIHLHGKRVGAVLAEIFEPLLEEGEELPDYVLLQRLMARSVRSALADLLAAEEDCREVSQQLGEDEQDAGQGSFLRARLARAEAQRQTAIEEFDETYSGFAKVLEALYVLAGEDELAGQLRPRTFEGVELPEPALAEAEIPEAPDPDHEDPVQRRIFSRRARRPGLSRWIGFRIFRRRKFNRP